VGKLILSYLLIILSYLLKIVTDLRQVSGFLRVLPVSSTKKTDRHDITEIFLKVAFNTITLTIAHLEVMLCSKSKQISFLYD
jgi:hypothetical protein